MHKQASYISVATAVSLAISAIGGGMWIGALASDVDNLEKDVAEQKEDHKKDHDDVVTLKADVDHIKNAADDTQQMVRDIQRTLNTLTRED